MTSKAGSPPDPESLKESPQPRLPANIKKRNPQPAPVSDGHPVAGGYLSFPPSPVNPVVNASPDKSTKKRNVSKLSQNV